MKIAAIKILAASFVVAVFTLSGCKKGETGPKGDAGAQGPQGPVINMSNGGFVTGTLTGTRRDGTPFSEPFSYTYYFPGNDGSGTMDSLTGGNYSFSLQRQEADIFANNYVNIDITTASKTSTTGSMNFSFQFEKMLSSSKNFVFSCYPPAATATGLSYNASTGLFSGNFNISITGSNNNTGNAATIVGSFQATIIQKVYKQFQGETIKTD